MLGYASQIPVEDRWAIAVWVRALQVHGMSKKWNEATEFAAVAAVEGKAGKAPAKAEGEKNNG
jgi:hypothetical protein